MNRFRKLGFIEYKGRIRVHRSLLNVILHDRVKDPDEAAPELAEGDVRPAKRGRGRPRLVRGDI